MAVELKNLDNYEFGFHDEESAFALQQGHGIGLAIWEKPMISRLVSLEHPTMIEPGMVFALETYWPASDGWRLPAPWAAPKAGSSSMPSLPSCPGRPTVLRVSAG